MIEFDRIKESNRVFYEKQAKIEDLHKKERVFKQIEAMNIYLEKYGCPCYKCRADKMKLVDLD